MVDQVIENNQVIMAGEIVSEFVFSHEVFGEGFYMLEISVRRLSNSYDVIPLMISERLIDVTRDYRGETIAVSGQFRSYNRHEEKKNRLVLSGNCNLRRKSRRAPGRIRFFWMATYVKCRYTGKRLWGGRSRIFSWR